MFPALAESHHAYLNSGTSGPLPYNVLKSMRKTDDFLSGAAYLQGADLLAHQSEANDRAREAAARLVGAAPEDLALTQNTTHGMNLGVNSIDWEPGSEVISTTTEHPGCLVPLHALRKRFGVKVNLIAPPVRVEKVEAALNAKTRLISLSHVDWITGEVLPLEEICALARDRGVLTLVDGAQSVGNIPVSAPDTGADMYAFTGHKWALGPEGMGALYVRPGCQVHSSNVGYAALSESFDYEGNYELHAGARRFEASTMSPTLAAGFAAALEATRERGAAGSKEIRRRADLLTRLLSELPRVTLRSPSRARSGLVSFQVENIPPKEVVARLLEREFVLRFIPEPNPYVRASVHLFNPEKELEALTAAVGEM